MAKTKDIPLQTITPDYQQVKLLNHKERASHWFKQAKIAQTPADKRASENNYAYHMTIINALTHNVIVKEIS
jgi:hypothetical protein